MAVELLTGPPSSGKKQQLKNSLKEALGTFPPEDILVLSNSRKAASGMKKTARQSLESYDQLWCESITSLCKKVLRENYHISAARPGFRVISDFEKRLIVRNLLKEERGLKIVTGAGNGLIKDVANFLDIAKRNPGWEENISDFSGSLKQKYNDLALIEKRYNRVLKKFNYLDFVDLTLFTAAMLEKNPSVLKFKKVLIYEAEDMDPIMARIVIALLKEASDATVSLSLGSSIYSFRGARPRYFREELEKHFPLKIKMMYSTKDSGGENFICGYTRDEQARAVASQIAENIKSGINPADICIIARSVGESMEVFTDALKNRGINHVLSGGIGFFRQKDIITFLSLLRCILEGFDAPELDIYRTILTTETLTNDKLDALRMRQQLKRKAFSEVFAEECPSQYRDFKQKLQYFLKQSRGKSAEVFIYRILAEFGFLKKAASDKFKASLYSYFMRIVKDFSEHFKKFRGKTLSFKAFMENLFDLLKGFGKEMDLPYAPDLEAVKIMTVPQTKGEKYEIAYLVDMNEDEFPRPYRDNPLLRSVDRKNLNLKPLPGVEEQYQFEKRLFNIARTRAGTTVYCWYETDDAGSPAEISPFVKDRGVEENNLVQTRQIIDMQDFLLKAARVIPPEDMEVFYNEENSGNLSSRLKFLKDVIEFQSHSLRDRVKEGLPEKYSYTALKSFSSCPRKFFYSHVLKIKDPPSVNQFLGIAAHRILERIHSKSLRSPKEAFRELYSIWADVGFYSLFESRNLLKAVKEMVQKYYRCIEEEDFELVSTEESFITDFRGVEFTGRYDRIDRLPGGGERVVDYKTGKYVKARRGQLNAVERGDDFQIPIYYMARRPKSFSIYRLRAESNKMRVEIDFSKKRPAEVVRKAEDIMAQKVKEIASGFFGSGPQKGSVCRMCHFKRICDIDDE